MRVSKRKTAAPVEDGPKVYTIPTKAEYRKMKPGFSDMVGRAKWEAWNGFKGISNQDAMQQYFDLIESLS